MTAQEEREAERAAIVAWLKDQQIGWRRKEAVYRANGHNGPYLGAPSYGRAAIAIERGEHIARNRTGE